MSGKKWGMLLGVILVIIGVLGLLGGIGGIFGQNGIFVTNTGHDLVHLITGLILIIVAAKSESSIAMILKIFGVIYILVALLGFVTNSPLLGFIAVNSAGNILHLIIGIITLWAGFMAGKNGSNSMSQTSGNPM